MDVGLPPLCHLCTELPPPKLCPKDGKEESQEVRASALTSQVDLSACVGG